MLRLLSKADSLLPRVGASGRPQILRPGSGPHGLLISLEPVFKCSQTTLVCPTVPAWAGPPCGMPAFAPRACGDTA